jgi:hypothetical protein
MGSKDQDGLTPARFTGKINNRTAASQLHQDAGFECKGTDTVGCAEMKNTFEWAATLAFGCSGRLRQGVRPVA